MNKHIKKYAKPLCCLLAGAVLLGGAVFANYENANGYTAYKEAVIGMLDQSEFSADGEISVKLDGEELLCVKGTIKQTENGYSKITTARSCEDNDEMTDRVSIQDGWNVSLSTRGEHTNWYFSKKDNPKGLFSLDEDDRALVDKIVNFGNVLADTMVGNLKNNFVMVDNKDGNKSYQVSLAGSQVPELIRSGMSVVFAGVKKDRDDRYLENDDIEGKIWLNLMKGNDDPYIKEATCFVTVDSEGRLVKNDLQGTLTGYDKNGNEHDLTITVSADLYDYGTTTLDRIDMSEIPEINATDNNGNRLTIEDLLQCGKYVSYNDDKNGVYGNITPVDYSSPGKNRGDIGRMYISNDKVVAEEELYTKKDKYDVVVEENTGEVNISYDE